MSEAVRTIEKRGKILPATAFELAEKIKSIVHHLEGDNFITYYTADE